MHTRFDGIAFQDGGVIPSLQRGNVGGAGFRIHIHEGRVRGPARQSFQPQGPRAAKNIKDHGIHGVSVTAENIKQGLAHFIAGGADGFAGGHGQRAALVYTGGDSHFLGLSLK
jgi:hypothetical protein